MINKAVADSLGVSEEQVPKEKINKMLEIVSQTTLEEREALYAVARYAYSGEGEIWDIGCAAGGSSFCLASGLKDNSNLRDARLKVDCFDLFDGYSKIAFNNRFDDMKDDLEIFAKQTSAVSDYVLPVKMDITKDLCGYKSDRFIELAHIDAAKSPELWKAIFKRLSSSVIAGKTIWIFQDADRARLPWQFYAITEMLPFGEIIGGAKNGSIYFRFNSEIDAEIKEQIINDDFSLGDKIRNVHTFFEIIRNEHSYIYLGNNYMDDLENTSIAYCYYWEKDILGAREILNGTSEEFMSDQWHSIYKSEILGK